MGLKKEGAPGEAAATGAEAPQAPPVKAEAPTPPPAAAVKPAEKAKQVEGQRTLALRAAKRVISDPFTGAVYVTSIGRPGVYVPGNWIDAQMQAGILVECSPSVLDD